MASLTKDNKDDLVLDNIDLESLPPLGVVEEPDPVIEKSNARHSSIVQ